MSAPPLETLTLDRIEAPIGALLIATDAQGRLRAVDFHNDEAGMRRLLRRHYGAVEARFGAAPAAIREAFRRYFSGDLTALRDVPWTSGGTAFQRKVWRALTAIPAGETLSYGQLAKRIGEPDAVRAVGAANGANPVPVVVPCHRVIGADGSLTGFGGGLDRKRWLLRHEGAAFRDAKGSSGLQAELQLGEARV
ncbi:MAG: methylated-DNA--[protein]-cysteine S-methyltransferase [Caulobacteraceae bacterium]